MSQCEKAESFLQLSLSQKIAYIERAGPRPLFYGCSMTMCLIEYRPEFLQIEKEWVEMLLKVEMHIKNKRGENCLMILL